MVAPKEVRDALWGLLVVKDHARARWPGSLHQALATLRPLLSSEEMGQLQWAAQQDQETLDTTVLSLATRYQSA